MIWLAKNVTRNWEPWQHLYSITHQLASSIKHHLSKNHSQNSLSRNQSSGIIYENVSTPSRNPVYVNYRPSRFLTPVKARHCSNKELSTTPAPSPIYLTPMTAAKIVPVQRKGQDTVLYNTPVKRNYQSRVSSWNFLCLICELLFNIHPLFVIITLVNLMWSLFDKTFSVISTLYPEHCPTVFSIWCKLNTC